MICTTRKVLIVRRVSIEHHVLRKTRHEDPTETSQRRRAKTTWRSALREPQKRLDCLVDCFLPSDCQGCAGFFPIILRLLDNGMSSNFGDPKTNHDLASFSLRTPTNVRPFKSSSVTTNSFDWRASINSASRRKRRCSLSCRMRLRMNSPGVPKSPEATRSSTQARNGSGSETLNEVTCRSSFSAIFCQTISRSRFRR